MLLGTHIIPSLAEVADQQALWLDDGVALARDRATIQCAEQVLRQRLAALDLEPHPKKTDTFFIEPLATAVSDLDFLGFSFRGWLPVPSVSAQGALLSDLEKLADRSAVKEMRRHIRAWANYFTGVGLTDHLGLADLDSEIFARFGDLGKLPKLTGIAAASTAALWGPSGPRAGSSPEKPGSRTAWTQRTVYWRAG